MRGRIAFAVALAAHMALFVLMAIGLRPPPARDEPDMRMAPVYLADLRRTRKAKPEPKRQAARLPVLSLPADGAAAPLPATIAEPAPAITAPADGEGERLAMSRALRSRAGCATPSLLSRAERERCEDRLAEGARLAKYIPTPLPPQRRAYYDAIMVAKADMRKKAFVNEHGPKVGCKLTFGGPGGGWQKAPNGLKLGPLPCYLRPPVGPLSVEAGIQNPDKVVRDDP